VFTQLSKYLRCGPSSVCRRRPRHVCGCRVLLGIPRGDRVRDAPDLYGSRGLSEVRVQCGPGVHELQGRLLRIDRRLVPGGL